MLKKGRAATAAHRYDDAVAAFSQAVEKFPSLAGARARAERGYAHLLAKRYEEAGRDFEDASNEPADAKLAGQVWFNRGLVDEALGRGPDAELAFYRSNRLNPSAAAADRLHGKKVCPVSVERGRFDAHPYAGWFAWWKALEGEAERDTSQRRKQGCGYYCSGYPPKSESATHELLCPSCEGQGPWEASFGGAEFDTHVLARLDGKLWDFGVIGGGELVLPSGGMCGGGVDVTFGRAGRFVYARAVSFNPMMKSYVLAGVGPDAESDVVRACPDEDPLSPSKASCGFWCPNSTSTETYFVLDMDRRARVLIVRQRNDFPLAMAAPPFDVAIKPGVDGFELGGDGCTAVPYEGGESP
jgi:tetratricopeptide (TPR) repeat protein